MDFYIHGSQINPKIHRLEDLKPKAKTICQNANFVLKELHKTVDFATVDIELEKHKTNIHVEFVINKQFRVFLHFSSS